MTRDLWIISCIYTAEYGSMAVDCQNAYFDKSAAMDGLMESICSTYSSVGGFDMDVGTLDSIKYDLVRLGEHRHDFGDGNSFLWTIVKASVELKEKS